MHCVSVTVPTYEIKNLNLEHFYKTTISRYNSIYTGTVVCKYVNPAAQYTDGNMWLCLSWVLHTVISAHVYVINIRTCTYVCIMCKNVLCNGNMLQ